MTIGAVSRRMAIAVGGALALAPAAFAHRAMTVLSIVEWSEADKAVQVTHRLHAHDAELGLAATSPKPDGATWDMTQVKSQAMAAIYVEQRFKLATGGKAIPLQIVGAEIDGDFVVVYQEARMPAPLAEVSVEDSILRDVFDTQANLVNVRMGTRTRSLLFAGNDRAKVAKDLL